jgi:excinuclease UvrABC ATPase subunit
VFTGISGSGKSSLVFGTIAAESQLDDLLHKEPTKIKVDNINLTYEGLIRRMNDLLLRLRDKGNAVLVVEHKPEAIAIADHVVDFGPHAGTEGGEVVLRAPSRGCGPVARSPGATWTIAPP